MIASDGRATAGNHAEWGWGVGSSRVTPIYHQFGRSYPMQAAEAPHFYPKPLWPSDTAQYGVYYIRGPW